MEKKHVKDTVYKTNGTIRTCVKDAMSEGLVKINFTERINLTWNEERSRKIEYLSFKEVQKLKKITFERYYSLLHKPLHVTNNNLYRNASR